MLIKVMEQNETIVRLLSLSVGHPTAEKLDSLLEEYLQSDSMSLYRTPDSSGIIGIGGKENGQIEIRHIAVDPERRHQSIGREMIREIERLHKPSALFLETDDSAVGFYRRCGFSVKSLGEKYPGVVRYYCEKRE